MRRVKVFLLYSLGLISLQCRDNAVPGKLRQDAHWVTDSTEHFFLYAQQGVHSEKNLANIGRQLENIQHELMQFLKEKQFLYLKLYFLKDRETLASYTGFPANGYTVTEEGKIYFVDKPQFGLPLRHEMMHACSWQLWGKPKEYWLSEGIAVVASGTCGGYSLHALTRSLKKDHHLFPFQQLVEDFDVRSLEQSLQAASMTKYIIDQYGISTAKAFWTKGWSAATEILGITCDELETHWLDHIDQPVYDKKIDWTAIKQRGCE